MSEKCSSSCRRVSVSLLKLPAVLLGRLAASPPPAGCVPAATYTFRSTFTARWKGPPSTTLESNRRGTL